MLKATDFKLQSYLLTIFTPHVNFSPNVLIAELMKQFGNELDGQILSIPLPPEAPAEIPRITIPSADQRLKLEIAPGRINLYRMRTQKDTSIDVAGFIRQAGSIFDSYLQISGAVVGRLASVVVKFGRVGNPGLALAEHFCREDRLKTVFNRPENFELHAHKTYPLADKFNINSWVRNKTGHLGSDNAPIAVIEHDLNTLSEETEHKRFNIAEIREFYKLTDEEHESVLGKYYPSDV
jgi:hypothetical protein